MSWAATLPTLLMCAALLFVPGGMVTVALGMRGLAAWAVAPVLTVTLSAVAAILCGLAGVPWTALPLVVVAACAATLFAVCRWLLKQRFDPPKMNLEFRPTPPILGQFFGWLAGAALIYWQLVRSFGAPANISQTFDNIFHLNAVRYALTTENASSLTISSMTSGGNPPYFYPAAWHGLAALLVQVSGAPISVAANILNIGIATTIWILGCMLLVRIVAGPKPWLVAFAGILSASFSSFPILLLDFGVLYPNFLSIAMLPAGLASVAVFFGVDSAAGWPVLARYGVAPMAACGIALAHPNGVMTLMLLAVPSVIVAYWRKIVVPRRWRTRPFETSVTSAALVGSFVLLAVLWKYVRPSAEAAFWDRYRSPAGAGFEVLTNSAMSRPVAWVVSALMVLGIYAALRSRQHFWLLGCFAITSILFVVVAGFERSYWRSVLTGVWYNDSYRIAAILPLTALPIAALGFGWILAKLQWTVHAKLPATWFKRTERKSTRIVFERTGGLLLVVLLTVPMQGSPMRFAVDAAAHNYAETPNSALVSSDELTLINKLDRIVAPDDVIAVSPWTGGSMAFALADRWTTSRHTLSMYPPDIEIINNALRDATTDPTVCPAVRKTGVRYVLDFGSKEVHGGHHDFPGLDDLQNSSAVELVEQVGTARLYRVVAC